MPEAFLGGVRITEWCVFDNERNHKKTVNLIGFMKKTFGN